MYFSLFFYQNIEYRDIIELYFRLINCKGVVFVLTTKGKKTQHLAYKRYVCIYTTLKQIELESPLLRFVEKLSTCKHKLDFAFFSLDRRQLQNELIQKVKLCHKWLIISIIPLGAQKSHNFQMEFFLSFQMIKRKIMNLKRLRIL